MTAQVTELGSRLKKMRKQAGLSIRALAAELKVSSEAIRKIEKGSTKSPRAELLYALARELDVSPDYLMYGQEPEEISTTSHKPVISQVQDSVIEVNLPYRVTLDDQDREELARRLAVEFEIIHERRNAMSNHVRAPKMRNEL